VSVTPAAVAVNIVVAAETAVVAVAAITKW
jgi:hypothetical protein